MGSADTSPRPDGRRNDQLRPVSLEPGCMPYAEGSCLVTAGNTTVICSATIEDGVPRWLRGRRLGWLEAEYAMLPRATPEREPREDASTGVRPRTQEIQRLIGRALRAAIDLGGFGERTITIDCDVLQADGGTRTASVTGGFVALAIALDGVRSSRETPLLRSVAAVSVGLVDGEAFLDLVRAEDRAASVDMNVVMTGEDDYVDLQCSAEHGVFDGAQLSDMLSLAKKGVRELTLCQRAVLERS
jgi:ribonuclease PH